MSTGPLSGKTAVITHATFGAGLAAARLFTDEGAHLFITGNCQKRLKEAVRDLGEVVSGIVCNTSNNDDLNELYSEIAKKRHRIDVLFASPECGEFATFGDVTAEHLNVMTKAVQGTVFLVQKLLPLISDGGVIIIGGSFKDVCLTPEFAVYNASLAVLHTFADVWNKTLKARNIRVSLLSPDTINPMKDNQEKETNCSNDSSMGNIGESEIIASCALSLVLSNSVMIY